MIPYRQFLGTAARQDHIKKVLNFFIKLLTTRNSCDTIQSKLRKQFLNKHIENK